jgi:hypothetical protein
MLPGSIDDAFILRALWRRFKAWWDADTGGWPTLIVILGLAVFLRAVLS